MWDEDGIPSTIGPLHGRVVGTCEMICDPPPMLRTVAIFALFFAMLPLADGVELTSAAELRAITPARLEEKLPVRITGVVTSVRGQEYPEFTLQDGTGGLIAHLDEPVDGRVSPGQRVEIEGVTDPRAPSPRVKVSRFIPGAMVGMPAPLKVVPSTLGDGSKDCSYVEFSGVIRRVQIEESVPPTRLVLDFGPGDRRLSVWVSHFDDEVVARLQPDAEVVVRGICNSWRRPGAQPFTTFVTVAVPSQIDLVRPALTGGGERPGRPLAELLSLPVNDYGMHRERAGGVVTLSWPDGQIVLQDGLKSIRTYSDEPVSLRLGEHVDASGFPTRMEGMLILENTIYSPQGTAALVEPEEISPDVLIRESSIHDREGRVLRIAGIFEQAVPMPHQLALQIRAGKSVFQALLPPGEALPAGLVPGGGVWLTGVCRMSFSDHARKFGRAPDQFSLQLQDARAITLVRQESWWPWPGLLVVGAPLVVAPLLWVIILRRRVRKRGELLVREIRARHDAELVAAERMRLAADLHDTLSQSLSGAAMQLEVAGNLAAEGVQPDEHLGLAKRLLDRGREDLRRTVWDLSPSALADQDLAAALEKVARESAGNREVAVRRLGDIAAIPERIRVHLFRAGQEALNNALRHGDPRSLEIVVEVLEGRIRLEIADDGKGFDLATAPGPEEGHFGLRSLAERITRLGGELKIASSAGGTKITAIVPLST